MNTPPTSPVHSSARLVPTMYDLELQTYDHKIPMLPSPPVSTYGMGVMPVLEYWSVPLDFMSSETTPLMCDDMIMLDHWPLKNRALFVDLEEPVALDSQQQQQHDDCHHKSHRGEVEERITMASPTIVVATAPTVPAVVAVVRSAKDTIQTTKTSHKRHICTLCDRSFSRLTDLRRHKRTSLRHIQKQYHCEHCNHIFTRPHDVRRHAVKAHGIEGFTV